MQRTLRSIGILIAALFFCMSMNRAHAAEVTDTQATPLPSMCFGIRSVANVNGTPPACCGFGYVYDGETGEPLDGVTVTIQSDHKVDTIITSADGLSEASYFEANLSEGFDVEPGDILTLTATYNGVTVTKLHTVDSDGQQIDLVLPTAQSDLSPIATFSYIHENLLGDLLTGIRLLGQGADRDNLGTGAMRYLWKSDIDGILSEEAHFTLNLADLSAGNHHISLEVQDDEGNWSEPVTRPLSHMVYQFSEGWNALNLAALPHDLNDGRMLMEAVAEQGGCPVEIAWWDGSGWSPIPYGVPIGYTELEPEMPYFLRTSCESKLTLLSRESLQEDQSVQLSTGWTFVTYSHSAAPMTSAAACEQINQQGGTAAEIVRWNASVGDWSSYGCGLPFGSFELAPGGDYFIRSQSASTWVPQPVIVAAQAAPQAMSELEDMAEIQNISLVTPRPKITNRWVTNRRDTSVTITWRTDLPADSQVLYGTDRNSLLNQAYDDRGEAFQGTTHHVTLRNLMPETVYYYKIKSKNSTADNNGRLYSIKTGPTLPIANIDPVYGQVFEKGGRVVADDGIVYLRLRDKDGTGNGNSGWMSALINKDGYWVGVGNTALNLGAARTADGNNYFSYSASGDQLQLQATIGAACSKIINVDTLNDRPARNINLPCLSTPLYFSSASGGKVGGRAFNDEDILYFHPGTGRWLLYFDGSDVGVRTTDVNAFHLLRNGDILMSFNTPITLGNLKVDDSDIVRFRPTSLGTRTRGKFTMYLDGSDVGLTAGTEDIDGISVDVQGNLIISTLGNFNVPRENGGQLTGGDEDLIRFHKSRLGNRTVGKWSRYFDGSDLKLTANGEDIAAVWIDPENSDVHLSTLTDYNATGNFKGDSDNVFSCDPGRLGNRVQCTLRLLWDGDQHGFGSELVDGYARIYSDGYAGFVQAASADEGDTLEAESDAEEVEVDDHLHDDVADAYLTYLPVIVR